MSKNILIVDDALEDLETMKTVLEKEGYEVTPVSDGAEAFDILENDDFDLVLIDIKMPTLSGFDLLRLLREKLNHKVKMMFVTIVPKDDVDMTDIDGFVQKPFDNETLLAEVKRLIE